MTIPASATINIPQLFVDAFGVYTRFPVYVLGDRKPGAPTKPVVMEKWELGQYAPATNSELGSNKALIAPSGVPLWDRFGFKHPDLEEDADPVFYMPFATVAEITRTKNMVTTPMIGNDGTVKELIGDGDHVITFRGFCINFDNPKMYPEREVAALKKMLALKSSLPIVSRLMNDAHGIFDIAFTNEYWPSMEGYANIQPFELTALSDVNIVLDLSNQ